MQPIPQSDDATVRMTADPDAAAANVVAGCEGDAAAVGKNGGEESERDVQRMRQSKDATDANADDAIDDD